MKITKTITARQLKIGQEVLGWRQTQRYTFMTGYVLEVNSGVVTIAQWKPDGKPLQVSADAFFDVEMTREEVEAKYRAWATTTYNALHNRLEPYEIGRHEMCNSWVDSDLFDLAWELHHFDNANNPLELLGVCWDPPMTFDAPLAVREGNEVGLCVEDHQGDKFWCHVSRNIVKSMLEDYELRGDEMVYRKEMPH